MKRNLLLLATILTVLIFSGTGWAACDPNDNGTCDTFYLELWQPDSSYDGPGLDLVRFAAYMTNDIPDPSLDSIAGVDVPLCFTSSNPAAYCSVRTAYNKESLTHAYSIFRDLDGMKTWMRELYEDPDGPYHWASIILNWADPTAFRLSMIPTTQPLTGNYQHKYSFVVTFQIKDSTEICVDTCFWPPSTRIAFSRKDAATYQPIVSWAGQGPYCKNIVIIPNQPPIATCPQTQNQHTNGQFTATGVSVTDPDCPSISNLMSLKAVLITGAGCVDTHFVFVPAFTAGGCSYTGGLQYTVLNHCCAGATVAIIVLDNLGGVDTCFFGINLDNGAPTINAGGDKEGPYNVQLCSDVPVTGDPDGDVVTWDIDGIDPTPVGTIQIVGNKVCFDATCEDVSHVYTVTLTATDVCDAFTEDAFTFHVTNQPPTIHCPLSGDEAVEAGHYISSTSFSASDPEEGNMTGSVYFVSIAPPVAPEPEPYICGTNVCWDPTTGIPDGDYTITLGVKDQCNLAVTCEFGVKKTSKAPGTVIIPNIVYERFGFGHWDYFCWQEEIGCGNYIELDDACEPYYGINPGDFFEIPIILEAPKVPGHAGIGGFELEVDFDYIDLTFYGAMRGGLLERRQDENGIFYSWEYFTYRMLPCPLCACCKNKILLYGQADMPDGDFRQGYCLDNPPDWPNSWWYVDTAIVHHKVGEDTYAPIGATLAWLKFQVANNELLRDLKLPIVFEWEHKLSNVAPYYIIQDWDCAENTFSDCSGTRLFVSKDTMQYQPGVCPIDVERILNFVNGGVHICSPCTAFTCVRGDINMDGVVNSVADAVMFARYLVDGINVFTINRSEQLCATDINADGRPGMLSDLVYLIRVILHDATAFPKLTPSSDVANVIVSNGTIVTECASPIGAILFEFDGTVNPTLLATNMEMMNDGNKVLVWSRTGNSIEATSEVLSAGDAKLVSVTAVDRDSRELATTITAAKVAPTTFALHPAYPNPFNPFTNLSFTLPEAVSYGLKIYNVAGQLVRSFDGMGQVGLNAITWDGKDNAGNAVSSGVYFYKLTAGKFSATEKMVMMK
jgi:hypothetical protein